MVGRGFYEPVRFSGWPELKEAFISGHTKATFILAPLAMKLRQQGIPIRIVYLGHRDGTALMVHKDSGIYDFKDLKGKRLAVPNRFSNQFLIIFKALRDRGMSIKDVEIVEMPPPDMPAALYAKAVDLITSGEPFMAQTEMDGYGRVLYQAKELWPNFISCVLAVHEDEIKNHPQWIQQMVDGIAKSGKWLEDGMDHRMSAADAVAKHYYNQNPRLLRFVLSKPPDRVTYGNLLLAKQEFEYIAELALAGGILTGPIAFEEYADPRFSEKTAGALSYVWEPDTVQREGEIQ
ncbi:MAG: ABC transporter substrate-binding protein [candidate division KSB1 bacterium]|nr:ABC transporter substrate-binding protein [candidate division KSB1 bacterium]MDZ7369227.1 ABC transporter substrate-binding protein [candidate division KSB1 bacterium]MDZ7407239.1 ABC transporter substrate-binding protein [candidate division KSB1 bacterium]